MRVLAIAGLLMLLTWSAPGLANVRQAVGAVGSESPGDPQGGAVSNVVSADQDFIKWAVTQGGLTLVLILVLWQYRRDFFRKLDELKNAHDTTQLEKRELREVLQANAKAMSDHSTATALNTEATNRVARGIELLAPGVRDRS